MSNFSELDEMMGYSTENLSDIFKSDVESASTNSNIYKTSPAKTTSDDGHYYCKVRLMRNPHNRKRSIVHSATYNIHDADGYLTVKSSLGDANDPASPYFSTAKQCPLFKGWKALHFSKDPDTQALAEAYRKQEADYMYAQIVEDENQPAMVGRIMPMKVAKAILVKMEGKMKPSAKSGKAPVDVLNYLTGCVLNMEVVPGPGSPNDKDGRYYRETKYDLCEFDTDDVRPITKIDGSPLFTDEEVEVINKYNSKIKAISKMKSPEEQASSYEMLKANKLFTEVTELMKRAVDYVKENTKDLVEEVGYQPWDAATTARVNAWIAAVAAGIDPAGGTAATPVSRQTSPVQPTPASFQSPDMEEEAVATDLNPVEGDDDLPF